MLKKQKQNKAKNEEMGQVASDPPGTACKLDRVHL